MIKFTPFLKPAYGTNSCQVIKHFRNASIISGACWDCWNVDITVNESVGAIPVEEFYMQRHPDLGEGEGGAGVLLAVAGSFVGE